MAGCSVVAVIYSVLNLGTLSVFQTGLMKHAAIRFQLHEQIHLVDGR